MLIVIEGIDGSGKGTQSQLLMDRLAEAGYDVHLFSFPRYMEKFGKLVGRYLNGDFGELDRVHPQLASLLYSLDRFDVKNELEAQLAIRDVVICDRYVPSNIAHQCARLSDSEEAEELNKFLVDLEYVTFGLPVPNNVIQLDLPVQMAQKLIAKKAGRDYTDKDADLHESDANYLGEVRKWYSRASLKGQHAVCWNQIRVDRNGHIRSVEDVHQDIWTLVGLESKSDDN